jgi:hypothetical protein
MRRMGSFKGSSLFLVGIAHTLTNTRLTESEKPKAYPAFKYMNVGPSIAVTPKSIIDENIEYFDTYRDSMTPNFGVWVEGKQGSKGGTFLAHGPEDIMREAFGDIIEKIPMKLLQMAGELVASLVRALCVVFTAFTQNVSDDVQGSTLLFCFVG